MEIMFPSLNDNIISCSHICFHIETIVIPEKLTKVIH